MRWIKSDVVIESDGAEELLKNLGYRNEYELLAEERSTQRKEKLYDWLRENTCTTCNRLYKFCTCEVEPGE